MTSFLHKLVEELRVREQYLEDHSANPVFKTEEGGAFKQEYETLKAELEEFSTRVLAARKAGEDFDEHFERSISDEHQQLSIKIDSWSKKIDD